MPSANARYAFTFADAPSAVSDCTTVADTTSSVVELGKVGAATVTDAPVTTYARTPKMAAVLFDTLKSFDAPAALTENEPAESAVTTWPDTVATAGLELTKVTSGVTSAVEIGGRPVPPNTAAARKIAVWYEHGVTRLMTDWVDRIWTKVGYHTRRDKEDRYPPYVAVTLVCAAPRV